MAKKSGAKRGAALIALIAAMAFAGAPQVASAEAAQPPLSASVLSGLPDLASWSEEASWSES